MLLSSAVWQERSKMCVLPNLGILVCHRKFCGSLMFKKLLLDIRTLFFDTSRMASPLKVV